MQNSTLFTDMSYYATASVFSGAFVCAGAGIGGGPLFVAVFIFFLDLSAHFALPLSQATIFGVGIGSAAFLLPQKHPTLPRRLIDMNLAALLEPATLLGTIPGVYLNIVFPSYIITVLLALFLGFSSWNTLKRGLDLFKEEKRLQEMKAPINDAPDNPPPDKLSHKGHLDINGEPEVENGLNERSALLPSSPSAPPPASLKFGTESLHDGSWTWVQLVGLAVSALILLGTSVGKTYLSCYSWPYWVVVGIALPTIGGISWYFALQPPIRSKYKWVWSAAGFAAGLAAGFLGIGGGMVKSPLMISMGTTPQVATATASFMIMLTSACATAQFFLLHRLNLYFALWFAGAGMLGAFLGQLLLSRLVKYLGKQSWVCFFVATVIGGCTVAIVVTNVMQMVQHKANMSWSGPCDGSE